jgi:hypothetical protein
MPLRGGQAAADHEVRRMKLTKEQVATVVQDGTRLTVTLKGNKDPQTVVVPSQFVNVRAELCSARTK